MQVLDSIDDKCFPRILRKRFLITSPIAQKIDVQHWFMNPGGTIVETPALERFTFEKGSIPGVRIVFQREGYERTQTLYYLRFDLAKDFFGRNEKFVSFLKSFGPLVTFEKAASYLLFAKRKETSPPGDFK